MSTVYHVPGTGDGFYRMCSGRGSPPGPPYFPAQLPHCDTCTCARPPAPACPNGTYVSCGVCHKLGIIPDPGHELEFMPPGSAWSNDGKSIIWSPFPPVPPVQRPPR